jgi:hypothetical protein
MGGKNSGRARKNPDERRSTVSVCMSPSVYAAVEASGLLGSFSTKVEHAIIEWMVFKQMLVQYRDDIQKRAGTPTMLNIDAVRIYSCSEFQHGWSYVKTSYQEVVHRLLNSLTNDQRDRKSMKWIQEVFIPALRREGLLVQVINEVENDLFDVWVVDAMVGSAGKNCGNCEVLQEIVEFVRKIQERNPS